MKLDTSTNNPIVVVVNAKGEWEAYSVKPTTKRSYQLFELLKEWAEGHPGVDRGMYFFNAEQLNEDSIVFSLDPVRG